MQLERGEERPGLVDIKLGFGGLADFEFLVQGYLLVHGYQDAALQVRSVRKALPEVLARFIDSPAPVEEALRAFNSLRALEHRLRLYTNTAASRLAEPLLPAMMAIGLWPPKAGECRIESWHDLQRIRRRARSLLLESCPELPPAP